MDMRQGSVDQTRASIVASFWELYKTEPIERIGVKMVAARAGVHRSTFYRYFPDVYAVRDDVEASFLSSFSETLAGAFGARSDISVDEVSGIAVGFILEHADQAYYLVAKPLNPDFRSRFVQEVVPYLFHAVGVSGETSRSRWCAELFTALLLTNFTYWYEHQDEIALSDIASLSRPIAIEIVQLLRAQ